MTFGLTVGVSCANIAAKTTTTYSKKEEEAQQKLRKMFLAGLKFNAIYARTQPHMLRAGVRETQRERQREAQNVRKLVQ